MVFWGGEGGCVVGSEWILFERGEGELEVFLSGQWERGMEEVRVITGEDWC